MTPEDSCAYYYSLADQQHQVHVSRADIDAFVYALERFPSLSRVTITSRAHGRLFMPRYETPMIRAFPYGFVYPLPAHRVFDTDTDFLWDPKELSVTPKLITRRVFCSAPRMLAKREKHKVVEFVVEDHAYTDGVNIDLFDSTGYTYANVISRIQKPGFSRLELSIRTTRFLRSSGLPDKPLD
ncbi:hypothetical protein Forpe1208_v008791 [Fusarium oxysporum f. sp. rapae]|uniref:Uncharacterized protein n=1 Tax=Fusarium oxysporum f. sp. rapae TaxID=485398 RepID=A0A8J5U6F1_FUSOX|nr:hypothetical protein Forpe1208_v008791 [Fusarium oxysporum f. sp. rapae]